MKKIKKRTVYIILSIIAVLAIISIIFLIINNKSDEKINVDFLNVDEHYADSLLEIMTIEEKVAQIIICQNYEDDINNYNFGGYEIFSDSLEQYIDIHNKILDSAKVRPFIFQHSKLLMPQFLNKTFPTINDIAFLSISDTLLRQNFIEFITKKDSALNYNMYLFSLIQNIADTNITDTNIIKFYKKIHNQYAKKITSQNILFAVPLLNFSSDTNRNKTLRNFYVKIIENGLNTLYLTDKKNLNNELYQNFNGLILADYNFFNDYQKFFYSKINILYVKDSISVIFEKLVKISKSRNKYERLLDEKVKKILLAKTWLNYHNPTPKIKISKNNFINKDVEVLFRKIAKKSFITLKNSKNFIPIINKKTNAECFIFSENEDFKLFENTFEKYSNVKINTFSNKSTEIIKKLKIPEDENIIFIIDSFTVDNSFATELKKLDSSCNLIVVNIADKNNLETFGNLKNLIYVPAKNNLNQLYIPQAIYGGIKTNGKIPFNLNDSINFGYGISTEKINLNYDIPEMVNIDSAKLTEIDSIVFDAISKYVFPGCQIFAIKNGTVIFNKSYGHLDYSKTISVKPTTLYDVASLTKIVATTLSAMKMYEQGRLRLNTKLENYFKNTKIDYSRLKKDTSEKNFIVKIDTLNILYDTDWKKKIKGTDTTWLNDSLLVTTDTIKFDVAPKNNIFKVTPRQLLMHKSGIQPALPILTLMLLDNEKFKRIKEFYNKKDTIKNDTDSLTPSFKEKRDFFYTRKYIKDSAEIKVANGMYLKDEFRDSLWEDTKLLRVWHKKVYVYSDVNMILLQTAIDSINNYSISRHIENNFYYPLGLTHITFKPLKKFSRNNIAPTERDNYWRRQLIWGYVHDPSAALLGGIAGNAGIFSNAYSLAIIGQMLLKKGTWGGKKYLNPSTVNLFTATQPDSYRGLGFDKWSHNQIIASNASPNSYGHTGFTGTCIWIDPDNEIVFVFLSNRVHPTATNWKINKYKIRQKIHKTIYDAIKNK